MIKESYQLSDALKQSIDHWVQKFPVGREKSAVIPALTLVQRQENYLTEPMMDAVAAYLNMPPIAVYEVATFYSMFNLKACGRHKICVCTNISCMLKGSDAIMQHLEERLHIRAGETTEDQQFSLHSVECLGACGGAPAMQVSQEYYENMTPEKIDALLAALRKEDK